MHIDYNNILVFSTNIKTEKEKQTVATVLNNNLEIKKWDIDLEDIDSILRIESNTLEATQIIQMITAQDFKCSELSE